MVSFDAWKEGHVAPARQEIDVVAAASHLRREAISPRLKGELSHPQKQSALSGLRFSPDGRRLFAASASGVVQLWEVETGKALATIETGAGASGRGNAARTALFHLSPAATRLYAKKGPDVGVWDTETGRLVDTLQPESRRGVRSLIVSPDGKALLAVDSGKDGAGSLWDLAAKQARPLPRNLAAASGAFSRDGKFFAAPVPRDEFYTRAIQVIDVATLRVRTEITISHPYARAYVTDFTPDGKRLRGAVEVYAERLWQKWEKWQYTTKFWDAANGKEVASFAADESETSYSLLQYSADGNRLAASRWTPRKGTRAEKLHANLRDGAKLSLLDLRDKQFRGIVLQEDAVIRAIAFHPDGKWLAAVTQVGDRGAFGESADSASLPQPRIHLIEAASAQVRETLAAPPGTCTALAFSPDGKTLASSGVGKVYLWNLNRLGKK